MIRDQWYAVLEAGEVPRGRPVGVTRLGEKLVFWRDERGRVVCQRDLCPHRGVALSAGKVMGDRVQCPFHGFEFDASGQCRQIPAYGRNARVSDVFRLHTYPSCEANGFIYIYWGTPPGAPPGAPQGAPQGTLPGVPFFANIDESFSHSSIHETWHTHYSRAIENQLDVVHVPFIHATTIGRGGNTVVDGPLVEWANENLMFVYVFNRPDDGSPARRASELLVPAVPFHLEFLFPNLWQNHIGEDIRLVVAFAPVDDENTVLYLRFYQRFMRLPLLSDLVNRLSVPLNLVILHQDRRVVLTQRPMRTSLKMGEKLIRGDGPIVAYRRRREELQGRNGALEEPRAGASGEPAQEDA